MSLSEDEDEQEYVLLVLIAPATIMLFATVSYINSLTGRVAARPKRIQIERKNEKGETPLQVCSDADCAVVGENPIDDRFR